MSNKFTLGSLFDGIGGWQLAAVHNGIKPVWSSEIDEYPMAEARNKELPAELKEALVRQSLGL